jgi:hypothetical protein
MAIQHPTQGNTVINMPKTRDMFARCRTDDPDQQRGSTGAEIHELEDNLQIRLPSAYREFLSFAGAFEMDGPYVGSDCFLHHLPKLQVQFLDYMAKTRVLHGHDGDWFAFYGHQGYDWAWFYFDGEENPLVYHFDETKHSTVQIVASLDDFFATS